MGATSEAAICNLALIKIGATKDLIEGFNDGTEASDLCALLYPQSRDDLLRTFKWPWATRRGYLTALGGADWSAATTYGLGDYAMQVPTYSQVANLPEQANKFVYLSLQPANTGNSPGSSPSFWRQVSRAAWAWCYPLPSDLLKVQGIYRRTRNPREDQQVPYVIESEPDPGPGRILLTDAVMPGEYVDATAPALELVYTAQITDVAQMPSDFTSALAWDIAEDLALGLIKDQAKATAAHKAAAESLGMARSAALQEIRRDQPPIPSHIAARSTFRRR